MSEISEAIQEIYIKEALAHPAQPINITASSMRQPIKDHGSPRRGTGFVSHTKTLTQGGLPPESVTSFPYRGRLG